MKNWSRTIEQRPDYKGFAKARELIEVTGIGHLTLQDRRILNLPYEVAGQKIYSSCAAPRRARSASGVRYCA